jgi:carbon-monoxide dehydrogenase large subunit
MTMAGGAVSSACAQLGEKIKRIGAHLLQAPKDSVTLGAVGCISARKGVVLRHSAKPHTCIRSDCRRGRTGARDERGLPARPQHRRIFLCDPRWRGRGRSRDRIVGVLDYVACHDCGTMVNPSWWRRKSSAASHMGIGTALYEESPTTPRPAARHQFLDYMIPAPTEVPDVRVLHMETPSPHTRFGIKGMGEGGAIAPPAAVVNAINDALRPTGAEITQTPANPARGLDALIAARDAKRAGA